MKNSLIALSLLLSALAVSAQGSFTFHGTSILSGTAEVPANASANVGQVSIDLSGTTLSYNVGVENPMVPTDATINGPAGPSTTGPVIFDLGVPSFSPPSGGGNPGGWVWDGGFSNLTQQQISDLESGKWYVNVISSAFPGGELRGQIISVPEPSTMLLGLLGISLWTIHRQRKLASD